MDSSEKKAVLINSFRNGGAEKVLSVLINSSEVKPTVISIWKDDFNHIDASVIYLLNKKSLIVFDLILAFFRLCFIVRRYEIVKITSFLFWSNYLNLLLSFFMKYKTCCVHCVSLRSKYKSSRFSLQFHSFCCDKLLRLSNSHVYKSVDMKSEYENDFSITNGTVIYNPLDISSISNRSDESVENPDFEFISSKKYVSVVGRFHRTKNQSAIINAIKELPVNISFIFLGDGPELSNCIQLAKSLEVYHRCHFLGSVSNPYKYVSRTNLYLSASLSEGFPNALLEAIALGVYPIVFDCPTGPREILSANYSEQIIDEQPGFSRFKSGILLNDPSSESISRSLIYYFKRNFVSDSRILELVEVNQIVRAYQDVWF